MIPILFPETETSFSGGGLGRLADCISCSVTEELNGIFELEFRYPAEGPMFSQILPGRNVTASYDVSGTAEPFTIYEYEINMDGTATYRAHHISYRFNTTLFAPQAGIDWMTYGNPAREVRRGSFTYGFPHSSPLNLPTYTNDLAIAANSDLPHHPQGYLYTLCWFSYKNGVSLREAIIGQSDSLVSGTGFDIQWIGTGAKLYKRRGTDTTAVIRYASNLSAMRYEYDNSSVVDAVIPYWYSSDGPAYLLTNLDSDATSYPTDAIAAPMKGNTPYRSGDHFTAILLDVTQQFHEQPTADEVFDYASEYYNAHALGIAYENLTIEFFPLWDAPEYEYIAPAEKLKMGDTATVFFPEYNLLKPMRVVKTTWDVLKERYTKLEFGNTQRTLYNVSVSGGTKDADPDSGTIIDGGTVE